MARPSEYSCEAASAILDIIRAGGTLEKAAEAASVSARTILRWLDADDEFRRKYAQAREDFRFVRRLRLAIDKTSGIVGKVVVTAVVAAVLAAIAKGFNVGR